MGPPTRPTAAFVSTFAKGRPTTDIMFLEALALCHALELWGHTVTGFTVTVFIDNKVLEAALNHGSVRHRPTQAVVRRIFILRTIHHLSLIPVWKRSKDNVLADALSRMDFQSARSTCPYIDSILIRDDPLPVSPRSSTTSSPNTTPPPSAPPGFAPVFLQ